VKESAQCRPDEDEEGAQCRRLHRTSSLGHARCSFAGCPQHPRLGQKRLTTTTLPNSILLPSAFREPRPRHQYRCEPQFCFTVAMSAAAPVDAAFAARLPKIEVPAS
jgi:hypothetical protein